MRPGVGTTVPGDDRRSEGVRVVSLIAYDIFRRRDCAAIGNLDNLTENLKPKATYCGKK